MKRILLSLIFLIVTIVCSAQSILYPDPRYPLGNQPVYYVDSIKLDSTANVLHFINSGQIKEIAVTRNAGAKNGMIYITLKNHQLLDSLLKDKQLSLQEILNKNVSEADLKARVVYIWDDKVITDTTNIRFPSKKITSVTIIKASEMPYFKTTFPDMLIVMVSTKPPVIYIRGLRRENE